MLYKCKNATPAAFGRLRRPSAADGGLYKKTIKTVLEKIHQNSTRNKTIKTVLETKTLFQWLPPHSKQQQEVCDLVTYRTSLIACQVGSTTLASPTAKLHLKRVMEDSEPKLQESPQRPKRSRTKTPEPAEPNGACRGPMHTESPQRPKKQPQ